MSSFFTATPPVSFQLLVASKSDVVKGQAKRSEVHCNLGLIQRVVHILVFNSKGEVSLQKRGVDKDIQPKVDITLLGLRATKIIDMRCMTGL